MKCPKCDNTIMQNRGCCILTYHFCSVECFLKSFTLEQIKQLYRIYGIRKSNL